MHSHQALILTFTFISVVLAGVVGEKSLPTFLNRRSQYFECNSFAPDLSGAVQGKNNGTFSFVTGTFNIPTVSGPTWSIVNVGLGFDGLTCSEPYFQSGFYIAPSSNGETIYKAFSSWDSSPNWVNDFTVSPGDEIRISVNALSATSTASIFENLSKPQVQVQYLNHTVPLCLADAWWFVQRGPGDGRSLDDPTYFDHISPVTFTNATAYGPGTVNYTPEGAQSYCMKAGDQLLANITISGSSMTIA